MSKIATLSGIYTIRNSNTVETISEDKKAEWNTIWIYPAKRVSKSLALDGVLPGRLVANGAMVYVGEATQSEKVTPDDLDTDDLPIKYQLPVGETKLLREVLVQGTAGDGVWFKYWP